jgi:hypothetical protein
MFTLDGRRRIYWVQSQSFGRSVVYFGRFKEIRRWKLSFEKIHVARCRPGGKYSWTVTKAQFSWTPHARANTNIIILYTWISLVLCVHNGCNKTLFGIVFAVRTEGEKRIFSTFMLMKRRKKNSEFHHEVDPTRKKFDDPNTVFVRVRTRYSVNWTLRICPNTLTMSFRTVSERVFLVELWIANHNDTTRPIQGIFT